MKKALAALVLAMAVTTSYGSSTLDRGQRDYDSDGYTQQTARDKHHYDDDADLSGKDIARGILMYLPNRVFDLMDAVHLSGSFGPPGAVNVRATRKLWWGISELNVHRLGLIGKRFAFYQKEKLHDECGGNFFDIWKCGATPRPFWQVGVDLHMGLGARAAIDLDEAGDFLLGFFCIDKKEDDFYRKAETKKKVEKKTIRYREEVEDRTVGRGEPMK